MLRQLVLQSSDIILTHYFKYLKLPRMGILIGMLILFTRSSHKQLEQYQHPITLKTASNPNVIPLSLTSTAFHFCSGKKKSRKKKKGWTYLNVFTYFFIFYDLFILNGTFFCSVSSLEIFVITGVNYIYVTCCNISFSFAISSCSSYDLLS